MSCAEDLSLYRCLSKLTEQKGDGCVEGRAPTPSTEHLAAHPLHLAKSGCPSSQHCHCGDEDGELLFLPPASLCLHMGPVYFQVYPAFALPPLEVPVNTLSVSFWLLLSVSEVLHVLQWNPLF